MNKITALIERLKARRRAWRLKMLREESEHHAAMAQMHARASEVYVGMADELALEIELAEAGLPEASDSDFSTFEEASRAHG